MMMNDVNLKESLNYYSTRTMSEVNKIVTDINNTQINALYLELFQSITLNHSFMQQSFIAKQELASLFHL